MRPFLSRWLLAPGIWTLALTALAQAPAPTPTEPAAKPATEKATLRYTDQLTGTYSAGAVSRVLLNTAHTLTYARGRHFGFPLGGSLLYGKQNGLLKERELLLNLTPYYRLGRFRAYATSTYEQSNLRGIRNRTQAGAGPGWAVYVNDSLGREVIVSNLILHEITHFEEGTTRQVTRSSTRLKLAYSKGALRLASVTLWQPVLGNAADYRFSNATTLAVRVLAQLALNATYTYSYEQRVVENRPRGNTNLTVGVTFSGER